MFLAFAFTDDGRTLYHFVRKLHGERTRREAAARNSHMCNGLLEILSRSPFSRANTVDKPTPVCYFTPDINRLQNVVRRKLYRNQDPSV